jgi:tRNA 2-thiouridine synthesizing protein E
MTLPARDVAGYLQDYADWTEHVALLLAEEESLPLTPERWEIIRFVQAYYFEFKMAPPMRLLAKAVAARLGPEKGNSRYLYQLFPDGPAKQACKIGGLPKPVSCI